MRSNREQNEGLRRRATIPRWTYLVAAFVTVLTLVLSIGCSVLFPITLSIVVQEGPFAALPFAIGALLTLGTAVGLLSFYMWLIKENRWREHRLQRNKCPNCLYDIRHLTSMRCPECGEVIGPIENRVD